MFQSSIGGYQTLHNSVTSFVSKGFSSVTEPIASYVQNIAGAVSKVTDAVKWISTAIEDLKKEILKYISKALVELAEKMGVQFGGGAAGGAAIGTAAAEEAKKQAAEDLAGYLGTAFAVVGYVYMAYQVAMLIIQTVYKCTKEEYELNANRALKQCHYIGSYKKGKVVKTKYFSYCCYESPLARILQEQIQPQLGNKGFGTAKEPVCGSLSVEDFANVDWSKIDLSEWIALMQEAGEFGADTTQYTIEALTGVGSTLDLDSNTREDATERAVDRLEDVDIDTIRETVRSKVSVDTTGKEVENQNQ
jgi:conjugal transfer mating pair stabilization protein TraN